MNYETDFISLVSVKNETESPVLKVSLERLNDKINIFSEEHKEKWSLTEGDKTKSCGPEDNDDDIISNNQILDPLICKPTDRDWIQQLDITNEDNKDIKNYAGYLQKNAGQYILKWIIEGAQKAVNENYHFDRPKVVVDAINKYRSDNDWLTHFLDECCEIGEDLHEKSGEFYSTYRAYCLRNGDFTRSTTEFYNALEQRGFERIKRRDGRFIIGVKLREEEPDF